MLAELTEEWLAPPMEANVCLNAMDLRKYSVAVVTCKALILIIYVISFHVYFPIAYILGAQAR